jgi:hypothetical protein
MATRHSETPTTPESYLDLELSMTSLLRASITMRVEITGFQLAD